MTNEDDGSAEWADEQAAGYAAQAWFRRTNKEGGNGGELLLGLCDFLRSMITQDQWKELGGIK